MTARLPDRRTHAFRHDLAAESLRGLVDAPRYTDGEAATVLAEVLSVKRVPDAASSTDTELLFGEDVVVYDRAEGWAWIQNCHDGYVGYVSEAGVGPREAPPTHTVSAVRTFLYPAPDLKTPPCGWLSLASRVRVAEREGAFARTVGGPWAFAPHLRAFGQYETSPVAVAGRLLETPYLWGGRSGLGLDCSALVQLSLDACGISCPRDSDMQAARLGAEVAFDGDFDALRTGDLIYWRGHVGMVAGSDRLIHANATDMKVAASPLAATVGRLAHDEGLEIVAVRRPPTHA